MPCQVRLEYPGAMYHVMSRGNRRQDIYLHDVDRQDFLQTLTEACQKTGLGSEEFKEQKLSELDGQLSEHYFGQMRGEAAQAKAERIIQEELGRLCWREADLASHRKREPSKVEIGVRLRKETTLSVKPTLMGDQERIRPRKGS